MILGGVVKQPAELFPVSIDFSRELDSSETLSSAAITVRNAATAADISAAILSGSAAVATPVITQKITGGTSQDVYILTMLATTSSGNKYEGEITITMIES